MDQRARPRAASATLSKSHGITAVTLALAVLATDACGGGGPIDAADRDDGTSTALAPADAAVARGCEALLFELADAGGATGAVTAVGSDNTGVGVTARVCELSLTLSDGTTQASTVRLVEVTSFDQLDAVAAELVGDDLAPHGIPGAGNRNYQAGSMPSQTASFMRYGLSRTVGDQIFQLAALELPDSAVQDEDTAFAALDEL